MPGKNSNGRMPVLDLAVWIQEVNGIQTILHSFYKKPVASPCTILKRSALSFKIKKTTPLQEALRRLGNVSPTLPWNESITHLAEYSNMLRISGYTVRERLNNIKPSTIKLINLQTLFLRGVALYEHFKSTGSTGPRESTSDILPSYVDFWLKLTTHISLGSLTTRPIDSRLSVS